MPSLVFSTKQQFYLLTAVAVLGLVFLCYDASIKSTPELSSHLDNSQKHSNEYVKYPQNKDSKDDVENSVDNPLSPNDFSNHLEYHSQKQSSRMSSHDAWMPSDVYEAPMDRLIRTAPIHRPHLLPLNQYHSKAEYLRQPIVADYAPGAEKVFLMMKEGANVLWNRIPSHLFTTFTRVPYFAIYADAPASIGGYEVIDILANVSHKTLQFQDFQLYKKMIKLRQLNAGADPAELNLDGGWDLDKYKNIPMLAHALKVAPKSVDWFVFMDGDTFLLMDNLMDWLKGVDPSKPLYLGSPAYYKDERFAHGGSGVVISRAALEKCLGNGEASEKLVRDLEIVTSNTCCGDYMVANMLKKFEIGMPAGTKEYPYVGKIFQGQPQWNLHADSKTWCQKVVSFHHMSAYDVETLWEYERMLGPTKKKHHITYGDIYRDFVSPHIEEWMDGWNNMADGWAFSENQDKEAMEEKKKREEGEKEKESEKEKEKPSLRPWNSAKLCEEACHNDKNCLSWRYLPKENYCGLSVHVKLGRPVIEGVKLQYYEEEKDLNHEGAVSGFLISRIRDMRRKQKCDVLYHDKKQQNEQPENEQQHSDSEYLQMIEEGKVVDRYEGWYRRSKKKELDALEKEKEENRQKLDKEEQEKREKEKKEKEKVQKEH